jgi:hypothetical protein
MKKDGKNYPKEAIALLTDLLNGKEEAGKLLIAAGYLELVLIKDAAEGKQGVIDVLMKKGYIVIAGFLTAILTDNRSPIPVLLKNGAAHWAASANYFLKDKKALVFLQENGYQHYIEFIDALKKRMDKEEGSGLEMLFRPPI